MNVYTSFLQPTGLTGELREEGCFSVNCKQRAVPELRGEGQPSGWCGEGGNFSYGMLARVRKFAASRDTRPR